ncbi:hypothetical protein AgCh_001281 [Apium graveolens]
MKNNKHEIDHEKMNEIMFSMWEKMNIPVHCLGFALNPYYYDTNYLQFPAPGGEPRRAPNCDREVVQGVLKAFDKIGEDEEERRVLRHQLASFQGKEGMFRSLAAKIDAVTMSPISWWSTYGAETPQLSEIAIKILSQPISSSSAERVWSTYSYIHNIKRNRLNSVRADKLVYIHTNIRLISRFTSSYKEGPYRKWDIDVENSYLEDSMAKLDELRSKDDGIEEKMLKKDKSSLLAASSQKDVAIEQSSQPRAQAKRVRDTSSPQTYTRKKKSKTTGDAQGTHTVQTGAKDTVPALSQIQIDVAPINVQSQPKSLIIETSGTPYSPTNSLEVDIINTSIPDSPSLTLLGKPKSSASEHHLLDDLLAHLPILSDTIVTSVP